MRRYLGSPVIEVLGLVILLAACTGDPQSRQALDSGKQALAAGQSNDAIRDADAVISSGDTPALAEAYFLRGYAVEMRQKPDNAAAAHDFAMARDSYTRGLTYSPRPTIAARLHAQLGNVCYYQEDYAAAVPEFMTAFNSLDSSQPRDEVLYRTGISEQRLGRFDDADRTFQLRLRRPRRRPFRHPRVLRAAWGIHTAEGHQHRLQRRAPLRLSAADSGG
jgi:tetratricopeptide (TPR) repeat protein